MREVMNIVDGVIVRIYDKAVRDEANDEDGLPAYKHITYIEKRIPNGRDIYDQPVKSADRLKYSELFRQFDSGEQVELTGTPIEQWPALDVTDVASLKDVGIFTVQQLAQAPETKGIVGLKYKAQKWLEESASREQLRDDIAQRDKTIEAMQAQMAALEQRIEELAKNQKKKPGRPRKTA